MSWLTLKKYALHRGISDRMIRKYIAAGRIPANAVKPRVEGGKHLLINKEKSDAFLSKNLKQKTPNTEPPKKTIKKIKSDSVSKKQKIISDLGIKETDSLTAAQKLNQEYAAALKKLDLETKQGLLVPADEIAEAWERIIVAAKTKILGIKSKCAPLIIELVTDPEDREAILKIIDSSAREALNDLAEG